MLLDKPKTRSDQVNTTLRQRIREQVYAPGARLPSESVLADELGMSRASVRTALAKLATEGLILRKQGDGTFVNEHFTEVNSSHGGMLDFWRLIEVGGRTPSIQTIATGARPSTPDESSSLHLEPETAVLALTRLFLANDQPFILTMNSIPMPFFQDKTMLWDGRLPLHQFLHRYTQRQISYAIYDILPTMPDSTTIEFLQCQPDAPLLKLVPTFYDNRNEPVVYGRCYYNADIMPLRLAQTWS